MLLSRSWDHQVVCIIRHGAHAPPLRPAFNVRLTLTSLRKLEIIIWLGAVVHLKENGYGHLRVFIFLFNCLSDFDCLFFTKGIFAFVMNALLDYKD